MPTYADISSAPPTGSIPITGSQAGTVNAVGLGEMEEARYPTGADWYAAVGISTFGLLLIAACALHILERQWKRTLERHIRD